MNPKIVPLLQKIFWLIGWSILVLAVACIAMEGYEYFKPVSELGLPKREFYFLNSLRTLFASVAQAFFAFLVSAVFDMIFHRAPVRSEQTEKFLLLTCLGLVGQGVLGMISWFEYAYHVFSVRPGFDLFSGATFILSFFPTLSCFIYAITIYVVYRHFSRMVTFETEVV